MRSALAVLAIAWLGIGGCAGASRAGAPETDAAGAAAPGPELVGTWKGMAWAIPGSAYYVNTPVELTIRPDGTWQWGKTGADPAARGIVRRVAPDRVVLEEHVAQTAEQRIELRRAGDQLWGISNAFIPGHPTAVQLDKVPS